MSNVSTLEQIRPSFTVENSWPDIIVGRDTTLQYTLRLKGSHMLLLIKQARVKAVDIVEIIFHVNGDKAKTKRTEILIKKQATKPQGIDGMKVEMYPIS
jgi:hypothetical protein